MSYHDFDGLEIEDLKTLLATARKREEFLDATVQCALKLANDAQSMLRECLNRLAAAEQMRAADATAAPPAPITTSQPNPSVESGGSSAPATGDTARTAWGPAAQDLAASAGAVGVPEALSKRTTDAAVVLDLAAAGPPAQENGPTREGRDVEAGPPSGVPRTPAAAEVRPKRLDIRIVGEDGSEKALEVPA